jgi:hypothetical protein
MIRSTLSIFTLVAVFAATTAPAATILIDEDFNNPLDGAVNNTNLRDNPANFPDWNFSDTGGLTPQYKVGPSDGSPAGAGDGYVKFDSYGSGNGYTMQYDTGYSWAAGDVFTLSINATEQNWGMSNDRFMVISLRETARSGNNLTGDVLWTHTQELIYDANHDHQGGDTWGANNTSHGPSMPTISWVVRQVQHFPSSSQVPAHEGTTLTMSSCPCPEPRFPSRRRWRWVWSDWAC